MEHYRGVVVAGAGPVGLMAARCLVEYGVPVRVLERGSTLSSQSRASTFHPSSLELLGRLQMTHELLERGVIAQRVQYRDRIDGPIAEFDFGIISDVATYPYRIQFEQSKLCDILERSLLDIGTEIEFNSEVLQVRAGSADAHPTVVVAGPSGTEEFTCDFVIGADGSTSIVRRTIGMSFSGMTYPERYLVVSVADDLAAYMEDLAPVNYVSDPHNWFALIRTPDHWRATFPLEQTETDAEATDRDHLQTLLQGVCRLTQGYDILHTSIYRVHRRVADKFARGKVALIGDAAHVNNPLGGLGMNSGLLDAYSLAIRISRRWPDQMTPAEIDDYSAVHRRVAVDVVGQQTNLNWKSIRETSTSERARLHQQMKMIANDPVRARAYVMSASLLPVLQELDSSLGTADN